MADKRTYTDRRQALIVAVKKRRKKIKLLSIAYKGGQCQLCGYKRYAGALELHHINKAEKSFGIGEKGYTRAWEKVKAELEKCILLCANCHREVSGGITQLPSESSVEKRGELLETLIFPKGKKGQSAAKSRIASGKVQRLFRKEVADQVVM